MGQAIVRLLLDHPAVRRAKTVWLGTRDAHGLYRRFGFVDGGPVQMPGASMMILRRVPPVSTERAATSPNTSTPRE